MARGTLNVGHTALTSKTFGETWNLDATGNWTAYTRDDDGDLTNDLVQARTANEVNEIGTITNSVGSAWAQPAYSPAGNMTTIPQPKDPSKAYLATYDAWNRLVKLQEEVSSVLETVSTYAYDGRKFQIIQKEYTDGVLEVTKHQYYTNGWQNIEQREDANTTPAQQYVWGQRYIDDCLLRDKSTSTTLDERLYALQDTGWNVVAIVDIDGHTVQRHRFNPFGASFSMTAEYTTGVNLVSWNILPTGQETDSRTGLNCFRNRDLLSWTGNYTSRDPLGYVDGPNVYAAWFVPSSVDPFGMSQSPINARKDLYSKLKSICSSCSSSPTGNCTQSECEASARRMASAFYHTLSNNSKPITTYESIAGTQKHKGYWCYEWAWSFLAVFSEFGKECFDVQMGGGRTESGLVHAYVVIQGKCGGIGATPPVYVDDSFTASGNYVHDKRPLPTGYEHDNGIIADSCPTDDPKVTPPVPYCWCGKKCSPQVLTCVYPQKI